MNWQDKTTVKKGDLGESIVDGYLLARGVVPYVPIADKAHPFDRLCATSDKKTLFIAEVKTKAARNHYPDTGINAKHYADYMAMLARYGIDVWIFFVDEHKGRVYGNKLTELMKDRVVSWKGRDLVYPMVNGGIVYFPLDAMRDVCAIEDERAEALKALSTRNYQY